jgi:hypothetical protein
MNKLYRDPSRGDRYQSMDQTQRIDAVLVRGVAGVGLTIFVAPEETRQLARFERDDAVKEELLDIAKPYNRVAELTSQRKQNGGRNDRCFLKTMVPRSRSLS